MNTSIEKQSVLIDTYSLLTEKLLGHVFPMQSVQGCYKKGKLMDSVSEYREISGDSSVEKGRRLVAEPGK
jgi:hypothetical protein